MSGVHAPSGLKMDCPNSHAREHENVEFLSRLTSPNFDLKGTGKIHSHMDERSDSLSQSPGRQGCLLLIVNFSFGCTTNRAKMLDFVTQCSQTKNDKSGTQESLQCIVSYWMFLIEMCIFNKKASDI